LFSSGIFIQNVKKKKKKRKEEKESNFKEKETLKI